MKHFNAPTRMITELELKHAARRPVPNGDYRSKIVTAQLIVDKNPRTVRACFKLSLAHQVEIDFVFSKEAVNGLSFIKAFSLAAGISLPNPINHKVLTAWAASLVGVTMPMHVRKNKVSFDLEVGDRR